jgi:hypothetical protein
MAEDKLRPEGSALRLVMQPQAGEPEGQVDIPAAEDAALARAVADMDQWIKSLPVASELRWAFVRGRRVLEADAAERQALSRTAEHL